jgi:hypothetical protein
MPRQALRPARPGAAAVRVTGIGAVGVDAEAVDGDRACQQGSLRRLAGAVVVEAQHDGVGRAAGEVPGDLARLPAKLAVVGVGCRHADAPIDIAVEDLVAVHQQAEVRIADLWRAAQFDADALGVR